MVNEASGKDNAVELFEACAENGEKAVQHVLASSRPGESSFAVSSWSTLGGREKKMEFGE